MPIIGATALSRGFALPSTAHLLFDLLVVFVVAKAAGELFERLGLPPVVGEILAGILVGPSGLNVVHESRCTCSTLACTPRSCSRLKRR